MVAEDLIGEVAFHVGNGYAGEQRDLQSIGGLDEGLGDVAPRLEGDGRVLVADDGFDEINPAPVAPNSQLFLESGDLRVERREPRTGRAAH